MLLQNGRVIVVLLIIFNCLIVKEAEPIRFFLVAEFLVMGANGEFCVRV